MPSDAFLQFIQKKSFLCQIIAKICQPSPKELVENIVYKSHQFVNKIHQMTFDSFKLLSDFDFVLGKTFLLLVEMKFFVSFQM